MNANSPIKGFFAYPYQPLVSELMRNAVEQINRSEEVSLMTWEECSVTGKYVIQEVLQHGLISYGTVWEKKVRGWLPQSRLRSELS